MEVSGQIQVPLPLGKGCCGEERNLVFLPGLVLWIVWPIAYPIFCFITNVYKLELSLFSHSSNNLCYNSKKDTNISLGKGTQQLEHESNHSPSSRTGLRKCGCHMPPRLRHRQPDLPVHRPNTCVKLICKCVKCIQCIVAELCSPPYSWYCGTVVCLYQCFSLSPFLQTALLTFQMSIQNSNP